MVPSSLDLSPASRAPPDEQALARAADVLNAGTKVALLIGQGARGAVREVAAVDDLIGAGLAKALLGKARSQERRDGKEWVSTGRSRWPPYPSIKKRSRAGQV